MIRRYLPKSLPAVAAILVMAVFTSCTVDENAALFTVGSPLGEAKKEKKTEIKTEIKTEAAPLSWTAKLKAEQERKKAEQAEKAAEKAAEEAKVAAAEAKAEAAAAKKLAAAKKVEDAARAKADLAEKKRLAAEEKAEAQREAEELAALQAEERAKAEKAIAVKKAREEAVAAKEQKREAEKLAKAEAKKKAGADRALSDSSNEVAAAAEVPTAKRGRGGFFSLLSIGTTSKQYESEGHDIYVNEMLLPTLNPSNAKIEVSLGEQRARVYRKDGAAKHLVIDTRISSGKPGHATSTGTFQIKEKLVAKQSTLYGTWVNSSGETSGSSSDSRSRPAGASRFVGADMPYWMRINGGIGMHIGYVPDYPASHGCIRVPEAIQPLIYSKVGVGTSVTISH
jgi:chemotaxis protein histidine kinase CheA